MAYCEIEDIRRLLPTIVGSSSHPSPTRFSTEDYNQIIEDISYEMDQRFIDWDWDLPLDLTLSDRVRNRLKRICTLGVGAQILLSIYQDGTVNFELGENYRQQFYGDLSTMACKGPGKPYPFVPRCIPLITGEPAVLRITPISTP